MLLFTTPFSALKVKTILLISTKIVSMKNSTTYWYFIAGSVGAVAHRLGELQLHFMTLVSQFCLQMIKHVWCTEVFILTNNTKKQYPAHVAHCDIGKLKKLLALVLP